MHFCWLGKKTRRVVTVKKKVDRQTQFIEGRGFIPRRTGAAVADAAADKPPPYGRRGADLWANPVIIRHRKEPHPKQDMLRGHIA